MISMVDTFKLLSDKLRMRTLMLLDKKELCVCQIMGILESSQSLISRNLSLLYQAGFLEEKRQGKLRYYRVKKDIVDERKAVMNFLRSMLKNDTVIEKDIETVKECTEFQKKTGKCDMNTLKEFMKWRRRKRKSV
jgi:ArsR family transcriptional regulator